jgi:hypothetical protein
MQDPTLTSALLAAIGTLAGVVVHLWRKQVADTKALEMKLANCEKQHDAANSQLLTISTQMGELKGKSEIVNELKEALINVVKLNHLKE